MNTRTYTFRLTFVWDTLWETISDLYVVSFFVAKEKELLVPEKDGRVLGDYHDLRNIKDNELAVIFQMIDLLGDAAVTLKTTNNFSLEYCITEEEMAGSIASRIKKEGNFGYGSAKHKLFYNLLRLYTYGLDLAPKSYDFNSVFKEFKDKYLTGGLLIESEDVNVQLLVDALNKVLELNGKRQFFPTEYRIDEGQMLKQWQTTLNPFRCLKRS